MGSKELLADRNAGEAKESLKDSGTTFISDAPATELMRSARRALNDPPMLSRAHFRIGYSARPTPAGSPATARATDGVRNHGPVANEDGLTLPRTGAMAPATGTNFATSRACAPVKIVATGMPQAFVIR